MEDYRNVCAVNAAKHSGLMVVKERLASNEIGATVPSQPLDTCFCFSVFFNQ